MADNLNEQELQALFRKHLPMKQLPPEFADQLKKQVLAEVAATLAVKPVTTVVAEETATTPIMNTQERVMARKAPRSVRVQSSGNWLEWFRANFRLTPSMAMAGAMLLALFAIIVWSSDIIPGLPGSSSDDTVGTGSVVQLTASAPAQATETAIAVAAVVLSPSSTVPGETAIPEPTASATEASATSQAVVVTANPSNDSATPVAGTSAGIDAPLPTDTATPAEGEQAAPTEEANAGAQATLTTEPSTTPTRTRAAVTPDSTDTVTPEPTVRLSATPTSITLVATATTERGTTATPITDPIKRPLLTPTATSLALPAATATKPPVGGPVILTTITPFVPTPTPTPTPSSTSVLVATATPTVSIAPWRSPTPTLTETPLPTPTDLLPTVTSVLPTPMATATDDSPVLIPTDTNTPLPTPTNTRRPTATATLTLVPPTSTRMPTATMLPTDTPSPTSTIPVPTVTNTFVPTAIPTYTPLPTATATDTPLPPPTATDTPLPTATATDTPLPPPTATDTPLPTPTATATNVPPVINGEPVTSAVIDTDYLYVLTANDSDGALADLRFDVLEKPAWLLFENLGNGYLKLYGRPSTVDVGDHRVKIQVHDIANGTAEIDFVITVAPNTALGPFAGTTQETGATTIGDPGVVGASTTISNTAPVTETAPAPDANGGN